MHNDGFIEFNGTLNMRAKASLLPGGITLVVEIIQPGLTNSYYLVTTSIT